MSKLFPLIPAVGLLIFLTSCAQDVVYREFFEPTESTRLTREDGTTVGAVRVEASKNGVPNWSDNKSLSLSFFGL